MSDSIKYRSDIDGLRAIAVLAVVLFHYFPHFLSGGFIGVDVFFVISGYLITSIIIKEQQQGQFSLRRFYKRRILRLFPALLTIFIFVLAVGWFTLLSTEYSLLGKHSWKSMLFIQNINLMKESGYFDFSTALKPLLHLWSLSIEEQFYVLWPLLIVFLLKRQKPLPYILCFLIFLSFTINIARVGKYPASTFYEIHTRFWELAAGGLLAYLTVFHAARTVWPPKTANFLSALGLGIILGASMAFDESTVFPGVRALAPVIGSLLIIGFAEKSDIGRLLSWRPFVFIGLISYPLYLWHWPLLSFVKILSPVTFISQTVSPEILIALALSFVLATMTYYIVEIPLRKKTRAIYTLVGTYTILIVIAYSISLSGFPQRTAAQQAQPFIINAQFTHPEYKDCAAELFLEGVEWCKTNTSRTDADIVVIGDSHSLSLAAPIFEQTHEEGRHFHIFSTGDTLGFYQTPTVLGGPPSKNGLRSLDKAFEWAVNNKAKKVVLISRGPIYFYGKGYLFDSRSIALRDPESKKQLSSATIYTRGLEKTLHFLSTHGMDTLFVYDNPELGFDPSLLCNKRPVSLNNSVIDPCGISADSVLQRQTQWREAVDSVLSKYPSVKTYDPMPMLCTDELCLAKENTTLLFWDSHHLTTEGALKLKGFLK